MNSLVPLTRELRVLVVDDEPLARARLTRLLADCDAPRAVVLAEAGNAVQAMECVKRQVFDLALVDIHMPGVDGLTLVKTMGQQADAPAVVFVTAYAEHAVQAFELEAVDYLTKPVRLERLQAALRKVERSMQMRVQTLAGDVEQEFLVIQERNRTERVALQDVLYFKAELKYVTVRTAARSYILDGSLNELENRYPASFIRVHRNALIARHSVRALEKHIDPDEGEAWALRLHGIPELVTVSRRQLAAVRELLAR
ncbi:MAG: LytTR family DNA-binding domain-containing protein [Rhodoferax sp.]|nr:LytTR family DNA-binding domain-containing protein [Rhodoferax sp.]